MENFTEKKQRKGNHKDKYIYDSLLKKIRKEGFDSLSEKEISIYKKKMKKISLKACEKNKNNFNICKYQTLENISDEQYMQSLNSKQRKEEEKYNEMFKEWMIEWMIERMIVKRRAFLLVYLKYLSWRKKVVSFETFDQFFGECIVTLVINDRCDNSWPLGEELLDIAIWRAFIKDIFSKYFVKLGFIPDSECIKKLEIEVGTEFSNNLLFDSFRRSDSDYYRVPLNFPTD